jgi:hypothetical protein
LGKKELSVRENISKEERNHADSDRKLRLRYGSPQRGEERQTDLVSDFKRPIAFKLNDAEEMAAEE